MSNEKLEFELKSALLSTGLLQPISSEATSKSVSVMCRGVPGQDRAWLRTMESLLVLNGIPFLHVCKRFVAKDGKMVFGWHISVDVKSAKTLKSSVGWLCNFLSTVKPELVTTEQETAVEVRQPAGPSPSNEYLKMAKGMPPPRAPGPPGLSHQPPPPEEFKFTKKVVSKKTDEKGRVTITEEMPLPHVYQELNKPNEKGGGAKYLGGNG